jgi:hypothetical protein
MNRIRPFIAIVPGTLIVAISWLMESALSISLFPFAR